MADTKVSALPVATSATASDLLYLVDEAITSKNITFANFESSVNHDILTNYQIGQHRIINDSGTSATELWSANKIDAEILLKGDVFGPGSSTDNAIVSFDGTTGKLLKDSGLTIIGNKIAQVGNPSTYILIEDNKIEIYVNGQIQVGYS